MYPEFSGELIFFMSSLSFGASISQKVNLNINLDCISVEYLSVAGHGTLIQHTILRLRLQGQLC